MNVNDRDRAAIRSVIEQQLIAFQNDDAIGAFQLASLGIQAQFQTPENFLQMLKDGYQPIYRPRSVLFEELTTMNGIPTQTLLVLDAEGIPMRAIYSMEKQIDGSWRISGCYLIPIE